MRILVVANGFPPRGRWGTEFYTRELVRGLVGRGHELAVLHPVRDNSKPRFSVERALGDRDVPVYLVHNAGDPNKGFEDSYTSAGVEQAFEGVLAEYQPELVHFTYLLWGLSAGLPEVARRRGIARLLTATDYGPLCHRGQFFDWRLEHCHGPRPPETCARCVRRPSKDDLPWPSRLLKLGLVELLAAGGGLGRVVTQKDLVLRERAMTQAFASLQRIVAPTAVLAESYRRAGVPADKLVKLVYSLDEAPYFRARVEPEGPLVRFGYLGQFTPHKGLHVLFEAVRILERRLPESVEPWEVHLYGQPAGGRHRLYTPGLFHPDPGSRVILHPAFDSEQAPEVLAGLNALVVPSLWDENAPLTCLQARAAGIPVLGSDVLGIREVIEPPHHGLLSPPGDAKALADNMRQVILRRMGRLAEPGLPLGLEQHLDRVQDLYQELMSESGRGSVPAAGH